MDTTKLEGPFSLRHQIAYEPDRITTAVIAKNDSMTFMLKALDAGTTLESHAAPGDAIFTVIEGIATVVCDGRQYDMSEGDSICFRKGAVHSVYAPQRMKFSLLIDLV